MNEEVNRLLKVFGRCVHRCVCVHACAHMCVCVVYNKGKVGKEQEDTSFLELMGNSPNEGGVWLILVHEGQNFLASPFVQR